MRNFGFFFPAIAIWIACVVTAKAQTADEVIQKHIAATGGLDNWKKIHSIKKNCVRNSRGIEIPVTQTIVQGKGYRSESTTNGMTSYTIITDKEGWTFNPSWNQKPEALTADWVKQTQDILDIQGALIDYKKKGNKITYLGTDDVEGTECYKMKVILPTGKEETYFIDAANYYLVRITVKTKANGKESVFNTTYGDYQKLPEGIIYPMSVDNGGSSMTIKSIEINKDVNEDIFKPGSK
jgi:outer membrane lipoprotein-sorting protein